MIKEILNKSHEPRVPSGKYSVSSVGGCWRKKYMEMLQIYKEEYDEETKRIFSVGDIYHREIIGEIISKGEVKGLHIVAAEIVIDHPFLSGRIDAVISDGKDLHICDLKSAGTWTMNKIIDGICSQQYKDQVLLYMHITGIHKGLLLFVGKNKGELEEYEVVYDGDRAKLLIKEIEDFMINNVAKKVEPARCDGGQFGCRCCFGGENGAI